jgi:hypothetical protein
MQVAYKLVFSHVQYMHKVNINYIFVLLSQSYGNWYPQSECSHIHYL